MKSSGDRISDLESRLFRVFSLRFCAFTSQDAKHRELPTHGLDQPNNIALSKHVGYMVIVCHTHIRYQFIQ